MKKILLPTDFSDNAKVAADFTINLFCNSTVELHLYHFYGLQRSTGGMLISIDDLLQKDAREAMDKEFKRLQNFCNGQMKMTNKLLNGKLTEFISEIIRNNGMELLAMGTRGSSGLQRDIFGSNTTHVLNTVRIPVLVVPQNTKVEKKDEIKIAFASDFKDFSTSPAMKEFVSRMHDKHQKVHKEVVFVSGEGEEVDYQSRNFCSDLLGGKVDDYVTMKHTDIHEGLMQYLEENKPDLLMMVHRKNSFFDRLLRTSLSAKMALKSGTPLLIFKD